MDEERIDIFPLVTFDSWLSPIKSEEELEIKYWNFTIKGTSATYN